MFVGLVLKALAVVYDYIYLFMYTIIIQKCIAAQFSEPAQFLNISVSKKTTELALVEFIIWLPNTIYVCLPECRTNLTELKPN